MSRQQVRRRRLWQGGALAVAGALTVALTQNTTTAMFTGQTTDQDNRVTAAASFCPIPGSETKIVVNDTWLDQANPAVTYGGSATLTVRSQSGANAHALLRFTPLPSPPDPRCRMTAATLRLYAASSQGPGTIEVSRASTTWTSGGATWGMANRPAPAGTPVGLAAGSAGWHEWTVTALVETLYAGPNDGFLVKDRTDGAASSRTTVYEAYDTTTPARQPQLVFTWG